MTDIDYILDLLDCNNSIQNQTKGLELAKNIRCLSGFVMPRSTDNYQNKWANCARVLAERPDEELQWCLHKLFEWLQYPEEAGSGIIRDRLKKYEKNGIFMMDIEHAKKEMKALNEEKVLAILCEISLEEA